MPRKKKKPSRWKKAGAISLTIGQFLLEKFLELSEVFPGIETPYAHSRRLDGWPAEFPQHRIKQELQRMKNRGWIEEAEKQGKKFFKLTKKGKLNALYKKLNKVKTNFKEPWNGKWVMALFDIPESGRKERDMIRRALTRAGFYCLQKSVYVYPYGLTMEFIEYLQDKKLSHFIRFVYVEKMDDIKETKKYFGL